MDDEDEVYIIPMYVADAASIAEVYMQQAERVEFIRSVASGIPASESYTSIRYRKKPT